ncbi:MAG: amidohydrolase family protein [Halioglobus sp.]|nr:amidohydrolase family protein [Halieaceae bacterium]MDG2411051.1 amidohydrolase family protein [Halioglobus sp.]
MFDLAIRNGTVIDGSGSAGKVCDVGIKGDRIVAVGADIGEAREDIDAEGLLVTPGWVDVHTHYDGQVTWDPMLTPSSWNGVTTVVMGNCGVGFAPVEMGKEDYLIQLMEGVEDIPGAALAEGIQWKWETFPEYMDAIEALPHTIDFATQVPHGAVRTYVMGKRGANNEKATEEDVAAMASIVKEGLEAGALGFSTTRTILHRAKDGELAPGTTADREEVIGIGRAMGEVGYGVFEVASDLAPEEDELSWMRQIGRETGLPVTFACLQNNEDSSQWKRLLAAVEEDRAAGGTLTPQVAQRPAGVLFSWESSGHPFILHAGYQTVASLPLSERVTALSDPELRREILDNPPDLSELPEVFTRSLVAWNHMFPLGEPIDYEPGPEKSIFAIAERQGVTPEELAYDTMLEGAGKGIIYMPLLGYSDGDFEALREMMLHPNAIFGLSDGGAHCGIICDASMPSYLLTHWARDRTRGARIPIEKLVHNQTQRTAHFYGMRDRGLIAEGMKADINIIDFDKLTIHPPEMVYDLPASARRLVQKVDGYRYTLCSGEIIRQDNKDTGAMPGKLVRGPQSASVLH